MDIGESRIGVAVSDELGLTAQPVGVIQRKCLAADVEAVRRLAESWGADAVVYGLPLKMDGSLGPQAVEAGRFAEALAAATGLEVYPMDERLTTKEAERLLISGDVSRSKRKRVVDKLAAALILQSFLDRRSGREGARGNA